MIPELDKCYFGDNLDIMRSWPDAFIQTIVTSPPYWGLRDYEIPATEWPAIEYVPMAGLPPISIPEATVCLGLEEAPAEFIGHMVHIFRAARRVLRDDGTLWFNMGDSFAGSWGAQGRQGKSGQLAGRSAMAARQIVAASKRENRTGSLARVPGLKEKDMVGIPWRCAFALQADGWYLRMDNIWSKPNPMPESVEDRPSKAHEYFFLFSKSESYFYDCNAIREPQESLGQRHEGKSGYREGHPSKGGIKERQLHPLGRNKRSVWTVASYPYKAAHFATFPPNLIKPCILAGTPAPGCCPICREPQAFSVEKEFIPQEDVSAGKGIRGADDQKEHDKMNRWEGTQRGTTRIKAITWSQGCGCPIESPVPSIVLDLFFGSGTTGEVCQALGRSWLGCELNAKNAPLQEARTQKIGLL